MRNHRKTLKQKSARDKYEWKEGKMRINMRRVEVYLTDNVVIVRQVVSVSLGSGRRGVAQFPYVWLRAVSCRGN